MRITRAALFAALGAYLCWGLFPLYWRALRHISALEILAHRITWSLAFLAAAVSLTRGWSWLRKSLASPRVVGVFALSSLAVSVNWSLYIWAVNSGRVVEGSLGYFINPIVNLIFGRLVFKERLRPAQQVAVACAVVGVAWLTVNLGSPPWVSLALAVSFGLYGLLRKIAPLDSLEGLTLETIFLAPPALASLVFREITGDPRASFIHDGLQTSLLLAFSGVVTAIPLLLFASAARRLPLSVMGIVQYLSPTLQLLVGVVIFHEPFTNVQRVGFAFIWAGLLVFSAEGLWRSNAAASTRERGRE